MDIEFDPKKREQTLRLRRLDFAEAGRIFEGFHITVEDEREYDETRLITLGRLGRKIVVCVWTERNGNRRIISMREAEKDERETYNLYRP